MVRSVSPKLPLDPRKSPAQARSIETVRVILEAAARILEARGFEGYTTNAVAERAGVSVGSLYQYFPGKDALTVALIGEETALLVQALATARQMASGREALSLLIGAAVAHQMRRPCWPGCWTRPSDACRRSSAKPCCGVRRWTC